MRNTKIKCHRCGGNGIEPDHEEIGKQLRRAREASGKSIKQVAKSLGFSLSYLSDMERGRRNWNAGMIEAFKEAIR